MQTNDRARTHTHVGESRVKDFLLFYIAFIAHLMLFFLVLKFLLLLYFTSIRWHSRLLVGCFNGLMMLTGECVCVYKYMVYFCARLQ